MALFQKAASTPEEAQLGRPLEIPPEQVAEMDEAEWLKRAYRGDSVPQLTIRAVAMGSILGFFLAFTNLYIGLKTGWHLGVVITAAIVSFSIWNVILKLGIARTQMSILETNCMASTASAAGYSTGGTMVSAIAALLILSVTPDSPDGEHLPIPVLMIWTFFLAMLGVMIAIPMKRNMINQEKLKFPTGTAAAVTLQGLYAEGAEAAKKAKGLFISGAIALMTPILLALNVSSGAGGGRRTILPDHSNLFNWLPARGTKVNAAGETVSNQASDWTIVMDHNLVMIGAGALVGLRICIYMCLAHLLLAYVIGPMALENGAATSAGGAWRQIGVWIGAPIMVASGLLSFAFQWKTIVRAFKGLGGGGGEEEEEPQTDVEVPFNWFIIGTTIAAAGVVAIADLYFGVPFYFGLLAVLLTFFLALVASRATGESDITPTGAMGKIMQLVYGVLIPQQATPNLMSAGITAGAAGASADLLTDLKSGYLLGANPRRQFVAQFLGTFTGTIATVLGFRVLIPEASKMMGSTAADGSTIAPEFPAPAAQAWKAVAEVFEVGIESMHSMAQSGILWGLIAGVVMVLAERMFPKYKKWMPSATGVGLGFILPFQYPLSMLIGAAAAYAWTRKNKKQADTYTVPIASGIIAGESIMGVIVAAMNNFVLP